MILECCLSVIILGALHQGMVVAGIERYVNTQHQDLHVRKKLLEELRPGNDAVSRELKDFVDLIRTSRFKIVSIFQYMESQELEPTQSGQDGFDHASASWGRIGPGYMPLKRESAVLNLPYTIETIIGSELGYSNMTKFEHKGTTYRALLYEPVRINNKFTRITPRSSGNHGIFPRQMCRCW